MNLLGDGKVGGGRQDDPAPPLSLPFRHGEKFVIDGKRRDVFLGDDRGQPIFNLRATGKNPERNFPRGHSLALQKKQQRLMQRVGCDQGPVEVDDEWKFNAE